VIHKETPDWALPSERRRPLPEVISDKISGLIEKGDISRGEPLPNEHELARRFGVGRSSVRTALQELRHRGIVDVARGRGWYIISTPSAVSQRPGDRADEDDSFELAQLFEVRIALESTATSLAAIRATDEDIRAIVNASDMHRDTKPNNVDELVQTDEVFHARIVEASHNKLLATMYEMLIPELRGFREECFRGGAAKQSSIGHDLVVQFLRNRDEAGARTAMASHLLTFASRLGNLPRLGHRSAGMVV